MSPNRPHITPLAPICNRRVIDKVEQPTDYKSAGAVFRSKGGAAATTPYGAA